MIVKEALLDVYVGGSYSIYSSICGHPESIHFTMAVKQEHRRLLL